jgi:protein-S-isoprenylcysteine O-methyltransferase Ste14
VRSAPETVVLWTWFVWWITWIGAAVWSDRAAKQAPARNQVVYRLFEVGGAILLFGLCRHEFASERVLWTMPPPVEWIMVVLTAAGLLFTWWARLHLGRLWSANVGRKAEHRIVDTGPYGIVRHPIYTGIIFASIATAAQRGTAVGWLGAGVMFYGWRMKARLEETFLREQLGAEEYAQYARRVPMLVPFARRLRR